MQALLRFFVKLKSKLKRVAWGANRLPGESAIYPYASVKLLPARAVIVFAPHPDDEVLGCGGVLAALRAADVPVSVVVVSDGGLGGDAALREQESRQAALALAGWPPSPGSVPKLEFWRLPDRGLYADAALVARIRSAIQRSGADWVLAPSPYEIHPDHRVVAVATASAFAEVFADDSAARLAFYEVGHPLFANLLVDITPVLARKEAALQCFPSQLAVQDYGQQLLALNRFRSYTLGPTVTHAEAYQVHSAQHLRAGLAGLLRGTAEGVVTRLGL